MKTPKFWYLKKDTILSNSLYPLSLLFRFGTKIRNLVSKKNKSPLPTICVGNIVAGGAGITPIAMDIGQRLASQGVSTHFLSRGYGGHSHNYPLLVDVFDL